MSVNADRYETIGIKQTIRIEWMDKTTNMLLAGLNSKTIRQELHGYLDDRRGDGSRKKRSAQTRSFAVGNLMNIWVSPPRELHSLRDNALNALREHPSISLALHWAMVSAAYPFWFNVAMQTGRLLNLQDKVRHPQIVSRLKETYGDRPTISRYAQYVIRSFVTWGVLQDARDKGCYRVNTPMIINDPGLVSLILEAVLHSTPQDCMPIAIMRNHPAFFPFHLPALAGDILARRNERIEVTRYGLDEEIVGLKL